LSRADGGRSGFRTGQPGGEKTGLQLRLRAGHDLPDGAGLRHLQTREVEIFAEQQAGKTDDQILNEFVAENGKNILNVTPGLFGTAGPFVALSLGGIVVLFVIRRYMKKPHSTAAGPGIDHDIDPDVLDKINKDMAKLD